MKPICPTCRQPFKPKRRGQRFCRRWCWNVSTANRVKRIPQPDPEPPSPEEIAAACAAIREEWTTRQRRRAGGIVEGWSPPAVTASVPEPR